MPDYSRQKRYDNKNKEKSDYKFARNYSKRKNDAKTFITKLAVLEDLEWLESLVEDRLNEIKKEKKMSLDEVILQDAMRNGRDLAKALGSKRITVATRLVHDLGMVPNTSDADERKQVEKLQIFEKDYMEACMAAGEEVFIPYIEQQDIKKKIEIAYAITGMMTGNYHN